MTMEDMIEIKLHELKQKKTTILRVGKELLNGDLHSYDLYLCASLNRTMSLLEGFISMIESENFLCAAPFLRLNLDTLLRLFASKMFNGTVHEFSEQFIDGTRIDTLKDEQGKQLRDGYIVDVIST